jgi:biotin carboxylase
MKRLLFIGAGWEQKELIIQAKSLGFEIFATHPYIDKSVMSLCDRYFIRDSDDIDAHLKLAQTFNVNSVITDNCDYSLYTATFISEKLGFPSVGLNSASCAMLKSEQRKRCKNALHVNQPEFYIFKTLDVFKTISSKFTYPFIVKPNDSRGTFGVSIVRNEDEVMNAFFYAISNSPSRTGIVEKFIKGTLFTVDGFCFDDGHKPLAVASRKYTSGSFPITKEIIYPAKATDTIIKTLKKAHNSVVKSLGYKKGHSHGEYIVDFNEKVYLVECTNRGGGVFTSSTIVPKVSGINLNDALIKQFTGEEVFGGESQNNPVILAFLDFKIGKTIKSIRVPKLPYVLKFRSIYEEKDMVESIENCASRHMMLVLEGGIKELKEFKDKLQIDYFNG